LLESRQLKGRKAALVLAAIEKRGRTVGRLRMEVIADFKGATIRDFVVRNIAPASTLYTDGLKSYVGLKDTHISRAPSRFLFVCVRA